MWKQYKKTSKKSFINGLLLILLLFSIGCSDEFNLFEDELKLTGNYDEVIAVYANICPQNDINFLRINRGFAVDNFYSAYTNQDSIYFNPEDIQVFAHKIKGEDTLITYSCKDTLITKDTTGDFSTQNVLLYYFENNNLLNNDDQDIDFGFTIKTQSSTVTSKTNLLKSSSFYYIHYFDFVAPIYRFSYYTYKGYQIVELVGVCSFFERRFVDNQFDTVKVIYEFPIGRRFFNDPLTVDGNEIEFVLPKGIFYAYLEKAINNKGDTIHTTKRWMDRIYIQSRNGNADYAVWESFTNGTTFGFNDEMATYSNIENGIGYLTSYSMSESNKMKFTTRTLDSISNRMREYNFER